MSVGGFVEVGGNNKHAEYPNRLQDTNFRQKTNYL
jgi:hypothetical protein